MEQRLNEVELKFIEQQALLQDLSDVVYAQSRQLEAMQATIALLQKKLAGEPGLVDANQNDRPPHY